MTRQASVSGSARRVGALPLTEITTKRRGLLRRYFYEHPVAMDIVVVLVFWILTLGQMVVSAEGSNWLAALQPVVAGVVLFFRRRLPLTVLIILAVTEAGQVFFLSASSSVGTGLMFALYAVAANRGQRAGFLSLVLSSVPLAVLMLLVLPPRFPVGSDFPVWVWFLSSGVMVLVHTVATSVGVSVWRDRRYEQDVNLWAQRNAELAQVQERSRIAREMHDVVAHSLAVMLALSDGARVAMEKSPAKAADALVKLSETGRSAQADMQRVLGVLDAPASAEESGRRPLRGEADLAELLSGFRAAGLPIRSQVSGPKLPADPAFGLAVYRIIQESLTNVLRYGREMTAVRVSMEHAHPLVHLRVENDGHSAAGVQASVGTGKGLIGMRERAAAYEGSVTAGKAATGGWVVQATLHCPDGRSAQGAGKAGDAGDSQVSRDSLDSSDSLGRGGIQSTREA